LIYDSTRIVKEQSANDYSGKTHREDIDADYSEHPGLKDAHEKTFSVKISATPKKDAPYSHVVSGTKSNVRKFLIHHYEDEQDAKEIHPDVFGK
jgi:hypothetical protein